MANKKVIFITALCASMVVLQSFVNKQRGHDEKPENLKILPSDISGEELHKVMRGYSMALGVHCNYCHVSEEVAGQKRPKFNFPADDKPEKNVAREMMKMVDSINANFMGKIKNNGHPLEAITCVTCHNGRATPLVSVDSLPKKPEGGPSK